MEIHQIEDVNLEQLKKDIEADENIVSFALFYDRKAKKMYFVKSGDEGIIDKMVNKAAYSVQAFAATISKIAWRWQKKDNSNATMSPFAPGSKEQDLYDSLFGGFRRK